MADPRPLPFSEQPDDVVKFNSIEPNTGVAEAMGASFSLGRLEALTTSLMRDFTLNELAEQDSPKLSPQELNEKFPELEQPFNEPTNLLVATEISRRQKERRKLQAIVDLSPTTVVPNFVSRMAGAALDPLEIAAGAGLGAIFSTAAVAGRLGIKGSFAATRTKDVFKAALVENAVANVAVEPIIAGANEQENIDYTAFEAVTAVTAGALLGAGLRAGIHKAVTWQNRQGPATATKINDAATAQAERGNRIDVDPGMDMIMNRNFGHSGRSVDADPDLMAKTQRLMGGLTDDSKIPDLGPQKFSKIDVATPDLSGRNLFVVSRTRKFKPEHMQSFQDDYGNVTYVIDGHKQANGFALNLLEEGQGTIFNVGVRDDIKLVDLDAPFEAKIEASIRAIMRKTLDDDTINDIMDLGRGQAVLDEVQSAVRAGLMDADDFDNVMGVLRAEGFDGFTYAGGNFQGKVHDQFNIIGLFDQNKATVKKRLKPDAKLTADPTKQEVQKMVEKANDPSQKLDHEQAEIDELDADIDQPATRIEDSELDRSIENNKKTMKQLEKQGADLFGAADDIKKIEAEAKIENDLIESGIPCVNRNT